MRFFRQNPEQNPEVIAAVDLGSNSFHMIVARLSHGQLTVIDRLREMVRLAAGLDKRGRLSSVSQHAALECLARFGERLRDMHAGSVRVVGTSTLRRVGPHSTFIEEAATVLGHPIEVVSGAEEARLIYQGVYHSSPGMDGTQLVVDIGGGSTEIIRGAGRDAEAMESLRLGCVGVSERYFRGGKLTAKRFERASLAVRLSLEPTVARLAGSESVRVIGTSGTIRAAESVLSERHGAPTDITAAGVGELVAAMTAAGHVRKLTLPGLSSERAPVFPGGIVILSELMSALRCDHIAVSDGALREGLLYDMLGRLGDEDARERTVRSMEGRFNVDSRQAARVSATALSLLKQVADVWKLDSPVDRQMLGWAARLHEIGLDISHSGYHRHGAYLLEHSDMFGFPTGEQQVMASMVYGHRGRFSRNPYFDDVPETWNRAVRRLTVLLRLSVLLNRSRRDGAAEPVELSVQGRRISVTIPESQLATGPLTWADLEREQRYLGAAGFELVLHRC